MGGGWAQSNQKIIDVTSKKVKNNYNHPWKLACTLISEHFDGDWARGGALFDVII